MKQFLLKIRTRFIIILTAVIFSAVNMPAPVGLLAGPLEDPPITSTFILDDGTEINLPAYSKAKGCLIMGTANVEALWALQRGVTSYTPVSIMGKGIACIWLLDYSSETDLGPYNEIAFVHMVLKTGALSDLNIDITNPSSLAAEINELMAQSAFFYDSIWLNSDLGIDAGEQIWGYPKLKGQYIEAVCPFLKRRYIRMYDAATGEQVIKLSIPKISRHLLSFPAPGTSGATPGDWREECGPKECSITMSSGPAAIRIWNPITNRLRIGSGTPQLDMLQDMNFKPLLIIDFSDMEFLNSEPTCID